MKTLRLSASILVLAATAFFSTMRAEAHDVATRCTSEGCSKIICNRTGDRCRRIDEDGWYSSRYDSDDRYGRDGHDDGSRYDDRRYRMDRWRGNCDPDNPTCIRGDDWRDE